MGFPCGSAGKESTCSAGDLGSIPGLGRAPGEGNGYPLQYSGLENPRDCIVHGVTKSQMRLSDLHTSVCIYVRATLSIHPALSFHLCVHESLLYICVSIPAMQTA